MKLGVKTFLLSKKCLFHRLTPNSHGQTISPQPTELSFHAWWENASSSTEDGLMRQGVSSLIILGAWKIWNHRSSCVFDGAAPNLAQALILAENECRLWSMEGPRGLSFLAALLPGS